MTRYLNLITATVLLGLSPAAFSEDIPEGSQSTKQESSKSQAYAVDNPVAPSAEELRLWVKQLGSNRFSVRERASRRLMDAGPLAVEPLVDGIRANNIEARMRGLGVLRDLAMQDNDQAVVAEQAIMELGKLRGTSVAQRAADIQKSLREIRTQRAERILRRFGASLGSLEDYDEQAVLGTYSVMVTLGKSWRGELRHLEYLKWLPGGLKVRLRGESFSDEWMQQLAKIENVVGIELNRTKVSDLAFQDLSEMNWLRTLQIRYCDLLTDGCLKHLSNIVETLEVFKVQDPQITKKGFNALVAKNPSCRSRFGRGGFLGIGGQPNTNGIPGCLVTRVTPNEAATKAGIQVYDIITAYNGQPVDRFSDRDDSDPNDEKPKTRPLSDLIAENAHGDRIRITLLRGGEEKEQHVLVVLGAWP
ncbi:MAG: PDZ domain-containing protein [Rubripirellula sp.]